MNLHTTQIKKAKKLMKKPKQSQQCIMRLCRTRIQKGKTRCGDCEYKYNNPPTRDNKPHYRKMLIFSEKETQAEDIKRNTETYWKWFERSKILAKRKTKMEKLLKKVKRCDICGEPIKDFCEECSE